MLEFALNNFVAINGIGLGIAIVMVAATCIYNEIVGVEL